jgi:flavin-dependent dehydrogenase
LVLRTPPGSGGWFWYIPLEDDITSVGIVANPDYLLKGRGQDLAKIFEEEIQKTEACRRRVAVGQRVDKIYSILDYSYRSKQNAGHGFIIIGDAYGFLDPIYSSGVLLALKMAELGADAIHDAFRHDDFSAARLGQFQSKLDRGIESMRKLVYAFYNDGLQLRSVFAQVSRTSGEHHQSLDRRCLQRRASMKSMAQCRNSPRFQPPLYEQVDGSPVKTDPEEALSAKYAYFDDRQS